MNEIWKRVANEYVQYDISNAGVVRNAVTGQRIATKGGGQCVGLAVSRGKTRNIRVARLLYETFIGSVPDGFSVVCDGDIKPENLRLETHGARAAMGGRARAKQNSYYDDAEANDKICQRLANYWLRRSFV